MKLTVTKVKVSYSPLVGEPKEVTINAYRKESEPTNVFLARVKSEMEELFSRNPDTYDNCEVTNTELA